MISSQPLSVAGAWSSMAGRAVPTAGIHAEVIPRFAAVVRRAFRRRRLKDNFKGEGAVRPLREAGTYLG